MFCFLFFDIAWLLSIFLFNNFYIFLKLRHFSDHLSDFTPFETKNFKVDFKLFFTWRIVRGFFCQSPTKITHNICMVGSLFDLKIGQGDDWNTSFFSLRNAVSRCITMLLSRCVCIDRLPSSSFVHGSPLALQSLLYIINIVIVFSFLLHFSVSFFPQTPKRLCAPSSDISILTWAKMQPHSLMSEPN